MKNTFMSAMLKGVEPAVTEPKTSKIAADTQCSDCGASSSTVVAKSGMEQDQDISKLQGDKASAHSTNTADGKTTIITKGPLGAVFTAALNKQYKRAEVHSDFKTGLEDIDVSRVGANGQVLPEVSRESTQAARARIMTGLLPKVSDDSAPTCLNAIIQAMGQVRNVEFIFVNDPALGKDPKQQTLDPTNIKAVPFDSGQVSAVTAAVESVQIVIKLK